MANFDPMAKVELFDIDQKKSDQRKAEMAMKPIDRLYLCLDLMDLSKSLSREKQLNPDQEDTLPWIELRMKNVQ